MFVAFGIAYSYGAFLDEMREDFGVGRAAGAAFFSLTSLLYFGLGGVSGAASDRFGPRRVLLVGATALGLGLLATARAGSLGVALAAYGIGVGVGVACAYVPMVALVGAWFVRRRTLALGVAVAGIGLGTLDDPARHRGADRGGRVAGQLSRARGRWHGCARAVRARRLARADRGGGGGRVAP